MPELRRLGNMAQVFTPTGRLYSAKRGNIQVVGVRRIMTIPKLKFNLVEFALWGGLLATLAYWVGIQRTELRLRPFLSREIAEVQPLADRYGPTSNSRYAEEWIVRDFFQGERGGTFVDVGANHYQRDSNTYYLETELGWSGIAIEPQVKFGADYATYRPRTRFVPLFISDVPNSKAVLFVPRGNDLVASADRELAESESGTSAEPVSVATATLDDVLVTGGIAHIDFLSVDIELHEPQALQGFSIDRFRPRLVAIEAHAPVRQRILKYFAEHDYVVLGQYLRADTENLWFVPLHS